MKTLWDYQNEQDEQEEQDAHLPSEEVSDEARIEEERQEVLNHVSSFTANTLRDKVAWILNHFPETRDSDIALQLKFWETFQADIYNGYSIAPGDLYQLARLTSLTRERQRIQNQYKLFLASPVVRQKRGTLSEEEKAKAVEDKPKHPAFVVYMDESGKTAEYLLVGSIWFLVSFETFAITKEIRHLKEQSGFKGEFHFKEMRENDVPVYKELVKVFLARTNAISFKLISFPKSGSRKSQDPLTELYYHILVRGIEHENGTGRAVLPRMLQVWKDAEELGADKLLLANLEDRLKQAGKSLFEGKLVIDQLSAVESEGNYLLQVADLFVSSANRILNQPGEKRNHKDEFAEFFIESLNISLSSSPIEEIGDMTVHIML